jgi:hypothetical protein
MRRWSSRCVIESNQPKKPIPPGLKPIQSFSARMSRRNFGSSDCRSRGRASGPRRVQPLHGRSCRNGHFLGRAPQCARDLRGDATRARYPIASTRPPRSFRQCRNDCPRTTAGSNVRDLRELLRLPRPRPRRRAGNPFCFRRLRWPNTHGARTCSRACRSSRPSTQHSACGRRPCSEYPILRRERLSSQ